MNETKKVQKSEIGALKPNEQGCAIPPPISGSQVKKMKVLHTQNLGLSLDIAHPILESFHHQELTPSKRYCTVCTLFELDKEV